MLASVVVPVYNMPQWVGECISSLLRQSLQDFEIIVVDDCSTDNTVEVVESFKDPRIKLIKLTKNRGCTNALNVGFQEAQGDFICPLGADDMLEPSMLEVQSSFLCCHKNIAAVFGMPIVINEQGEEQPYEGKFAKPANRSRSEWFKTLLEGNTLTAQTMLYRRSLHDTLGYWDENLQASNDIDWFVRIVKSYDIYVQHIKLARVRIRNDKDTQLSGDTQANRNLFAKDMEYIRAKHTPPPNQSFGFVGKLIIATPFRNQQASSNYCKSMIIAVRMLDQLGVDWDWWDCHIQDDPNRTKNAICGRFLNTEATDLLIVNPEIGFDPLGLARVLLHEEQVVAGCFPLKETWSAAVKAGGKITKTGIMMESTFAQSGFMRIKRSALEAFREAYPPKYKDKDSGLSPDYELTPFFLPALDKYGDETFCERWLRMGGEIWVEPQITFDVTLPATYTGCLDQQLRDAKAA